MPQRESFWYRVGYAFEKSRTEQRQVVREPTRPHRLRLERSRPRASEELPLDTLLVATAAAAVASLLRPRSEKYGGRSTDLMRAGTAGVGAAFLRALIHPWTGGGEDESTLAGSLVDDLLEGAGQGLIYGALVEPRVHGSPVIRGLLFGILEYLVAPLGGMGRVLRAVSPQRRIPVVKELLSGEQRVTRSLADQVVFGLVLALLYGSSPDRREISSEV
jgi:hypothetical protein